MSRMFDAAESFNQPLDKWNVGNAADMSEMFWGGWQVNSLINKLETSFNKKSES